MVMALVPALHVRANVCLGVHVARHEFGRINKMFCLTKGIWYDNSCLMEVRGLLTFCILIFISRTVIKGSAYMCCATLIE